ncbi:PREDICTED: membrane-bound transcription factor site-1 protease isoform X2 [Rhagoletis zephyria]|uniref:membrane-bound transcription factor site-1 protease isoform X1 n=1 Tax=Rhagoletis zephyria TaxID=28612 RepID=UPI0008113942|nr:PREDICTED: membrane-bound transcription factor site-1 protease isoform X1 [Rhagoletis zephyria]XP_017470331.1 PREDICTED: membrane-bound transcription factor site-1 protease isoform X2 [Rhagoletis zephyria]
MSHFLTRLILLYFFFISNIHWKKSSTQYTKAEEVIFESKILENEYIVQYRHYYFPAARRKFLIAAFRRSNIANWNIIERQNAALHYPSDFDVIRLDAVDCRRSTHLTPLELHPLIKKITPQRSVQRILNFNTTHERIGRHLLRSVPTQITNMLKADVLWGMGITGAGVKVAVFDTGLANAHPHFRRVKERTNWTNEKSLDDGVSHGTFVAGVIASAKECLGLAPDVELHIYRVFTNSQVSYTSWFLDAFNYAIFKKIKVLNLSIGGPDFLDHPFVDKVLELSANKVVMISAIGNDGPLYGTLNNPGDQSDVIGVGGINFEQKVAKFSSRGMTTWELPWGYGRLKPDIVTFGSQVKGSNVHGGCRSLSGTSVASPVVAGAVALIASGALSKLDLINPSSMKQILIEGAERLPDNNMFEQGHGKLDILKSMQLLLTYEPKITLSPEYLDFTDSYMWPYSSQPIFYGSMSVIANVTILNGIAVTGVIKEEPVWHPHADRHGNILNVAVSYSASLWPWSGWMSVHIAVNKNGHVFKGVAEGHISLEIECLQEQQERTVLTKINFPLKVAVIPKPPRNKRILWDQFHSLKYPPGYIPRDNLKIKSDPLDWRADHLHTNFRDLYTHLRNTGYYIDILRMPYTCFNASEYGTLLIVDPEEEYFDAEIKKIENDVYNEGLSVIVFADWYNTTVMKKIKFFDENTRQWWIPDTGGANIPALNELLKAYGIAFSDFIAEGFFTMGDHSMYIASGTTLAKIPRGTDDIVIGADVHDQGFEILENPNTVDNKKVFKPILGLFQTENELRKQFLVDNAQTPSSYEENNVEQPNIETEISAERNPIINKRILLDLKIGKFSNNNYNKNNDDTLNKPSEKNSKNSKQILQPMSISSTSSSGRIAVFSDSNCLDSIHLEKACFWLLDAILEYTMNSHKSELLQKLNHVSEFYPNSVRIPPLRLHSSNLHLHSKVIDSNNKFHKKETGACENLDWLQPQSVNAAELKLTANRVKQIDLNLLKANADRNVAEILNSHVEAKLNSLPLGPDDERTIKMSLIFIMLLTSLVLIFFLKCFRRKRG